MLRITFNPTQTYRTLSQLVSYKERKDSVQISHCLNCHTTSQQDKIPKISELLVGVVVTVKPKRL